MRAYGAVHDTLRALRLDVPVVLHSWTGSADMTVALLQLPSVHVSLSGHLLRVPPHKALSMVREGAPSLSMQGEAACCPSVVQFPGCCAAPHPAPCMFSCEHIARSAIDASLHPVTCLHTCHANFPLFPRAHQVRAVPLDRLLLESDSPDGALDLSPAWLEALPSLAALPQQLHGADLQQTNRPAALRFMLQIVAAALGRSEAEVAVATRENARRIFSGIRGSQAAAGAAR